VRGLTGVLGAGLDGAAEVKRDAATTCLPVELHPAASARVSVQARQAVIFPIRIIAMRKRLAVLQQRSMERRLPPVASN